MFITKLRLKIRDFIKKYKWKVIMFFIILGAIYAANEALGNIKIEIPITTYDPYEPIIENGQTTPDRLQEEIEKKISEYIEHCNNKEYEKAYDMLSDECKKEVYSTIDYFKSYVDYVFSEYRVYAIQNYSNRDNTYIYRVRIFEDILATGLTGETSFKYFEDKISFTEKNGKLSMGVKEFIDAEEFDRVYEDQYIRIAISERKIMYDNETLLVQFVNKTEHYAAISDGIETGDIQLVTENEEISQRVEGYNQTIILPPQGSTTVSLTFTKFYDEGAKDRGLKLNNVRILRTYSGDESLKEKELQEAVELYSFTIPF